MLIPNWRGENLLKTRTGVEFGQLQQSLKSVNASNANKKEARYDSVTWGDNAPCWSEDKIFATRVWKDERYEMLLEDWKHADCSVVHFSVEIGSRTFIGTRLRWWMLSIGIKHQEANTILKDTRIVIETASHWILMKRSDKTWLEMWWSWNGLCHLNR